MKDLTDLKTYIIDSDDPHEVDDAISLEIKEGNKKNLWIHISNPCKLFLHDSNVDLNARKRNSSLYLIDQYVPMLPKDILEKANLAQNKVSETISAAIEFNDDGSINKYEITEAIIKPKYQLTYEDANEILELEPKEEIELIEIKNLLEKSITYRKKQGAVSFQLPPLEEIKAPIQVIQGSEDKIIKFPGDDLLSPNIKIHELNASGHMPQMEEHNQVNKIIEAFIHQARGSI